MTAIVEKSVKVGQDRVINTPLEWWGLDDLSPGDVLVLSRLSTGLMQARKPLPGVEMSSDDVLDTFGDLLQRRGYATREQVIALMQEIKREVAGEWADRDRGV